MKSKGAHITAVTGGIGSGKSVVCTILRAMGYKVYDTDAAAKSLIETNEGVQYRIKDWVCRNAFTKTGKYNRSAVAKVVFKNRDKLQLLNDIVHGAVADDMAEWIEANSKDAKDHRLFIETALLYTSGLYRHVHDEWRVEAPEHIRIDRVMARNALTREAVLDRIAAQASEYPAEDKLPVFKILNDGLSPVLPQLTDLLQNPAD